MRHRFIGSGALVLGALGMGVAALGCGKAPIDPVAWVIPAQLTAAHEAYLDGDFVAVGERIRDVLLDPRASDGAKENALELLDKAYEAQGGRLPSRFKLPPGYQSLQYVVFHNATPNGSTYQAHMRILTKDASHVKGFTARRLPDEVILDKATGRGHFQVRHDPGTARAGVDEVVLDTGPMSSPPADGVISLRLELDDGTVSEGFIIARGLASTATPEIRSPAPFAPLQGTNPVFAWKPFRSPEYASFERRTIGAQVRKEGEDTLAWEAWSRKPDETTELRVGSPAGVGKSELEPGAYRVVVVAAETRSFGPVDLLRGSRTARPFHVTR